ncbi:MAG: aspartate kinase [Pseudomonadota bacterium]
MKQLERQVVRQKFGGTSVENINCIKNVAGKIKAEFDLGNKIAVVISAMAGQTAKLIDYIDEIAPLKTPDNFYEYDTVLAAGEQISIGLLALTLQSYDIKARSWLGWQLPIKTDNVHGKARIIDINIKEITDSMNAGYVAIIAGFQGINLENNRISTLGRGGSDTSAVAIAAALNAKRCDIYTDVDGIYTTDPRIVPQARKLNKIAYEEMLELSSLGAKVLQTRSVEMAMKYNVAVQVLSSFSNIEGTFLVNEEKVVERRLITGIAYSDSDAQLSLSALPNNPGVAANVFEPLSKAEINVDMIVQSLNDTKEYTNMTFTVQNIDAERARSVLETAKNKIGFENIVIDKNVAKISVVGVGMRSHSGLAKKMFQTLADKGINILVITTSEIKISVLVKKEFGDLAVRSLHEAYELEEK